MFGLGVGNGGYGQETTVTSTSSAEHNGGLLSLQPRETESQPPSNPARQRVSRHIVFVFVGLLTAGCHLPIARARCNLENVFQVL